MPCCYASRSVFKQLLGAGLGGMSAPLRQEIIELFQGFVRNGEGALETYPGLLWSVLWISCVRLRSGHG